MVYASAEVAETHASRTGVCVCVMYPLVTTGASVPRDSDLCLLTQSFCNSKHPRVHSSVVHIMKELQ